MKTTGSFLTLTLLNFLSVLVSADDECSLPSSSPCVGLYVNYALQEGMYYDEDCLHGGFNCYISTHSTDSEHAGCKKCSYADGGDCPACVTEAHHAWCDAATAACCADRCVALDSVALAARGVGLRADAACAAGDSGCDAHHDGCALCVFDQALLDDWCGEDATESTSDGSCDTYTALDDCAACYVAVYDEIWNKVTSSDDAEEDVYGSTDSPGEDSSYCTMPTASARCMDIIDELDVEAGLMLVYDDSCTFTDAGCHAYRRDCRYCVADTNASLAAGHSSYMECPDCAVSHYTTMASGTILAGGHNFGGDATAGSSSRGNGGSTTVEAGLIAGVTLGMAALVLVLVGSYFYYYKYPKKHHAYRMVSTKSEVSVAGKAEVVIMNPNPVQVGVTYTSPPPTSQPRMISGSRNASPPPPHDTKQAYCGSHCMSHSMLAGGIYLVAVILLGIFILDPLVLMAVAPTAVILAALEREYWFAVTRCQMAAVFLEAVVWMLPLMVVLEIGTVIYQVFLEERMGLPKTGLCAKCLGGYALQAYVVAGLLEEALKYVTVRRQMGKPHVRDPRALVVYGCCAGAGFATVENIGYVALGNFADGIATALARALMTIPGHCATGMIIGCMLARQQFEGKAYGPLQILFAPVLIHGTYDMVLITTTDGSGEAWAVATGVFAAVFIDVVSYFILRRMVVDLQRKFPPVDLHVLIDAGEVPVPSASCCCHVASALPVCCIK